MENLGIGGRLRQILPGWYRYYKQDKRGYSLLFSQQVRYYAGLLFRSFLYFAQHETAQREQYQRAQRRTCGNDKYNQ